MWVDIVTEFEEEEHRQRHTAEEPEPECLLCCMNGWVEMTDATD